MVTLQQLRISKKEENLWKQVTTVKVDAARQGDGTDDSVLKRETLLMQSIKTVMTIPCTRPDGIYLIRDATYKP